MRNNKSASRAGVNRPQLTQRSRGPGPSQASDRPGSRAERLQWPGAALQQRRGAACWGEDPSWGARVGRGSGWDGGGRRQATLSPPPVGDRAAAAASRQSFPHALGVSSHWDGGEDPDQWAAHRPSPRGPLKDALQQEETEGGNQSLVGPRAWPLEEPVFQISLLGVLGPPSHHRGGAGDGVYHPFWRRKG